MFSHFLFKTLMGKLRYRSSVLVDVKKVSRGKIKVLFAHFASFEQMSWSRDRHCSFGFLAMCSGVLAILSFFVRMNVYPSNIYRVRFRVFHFKVSS